MHHFMIFLSMLASSSVFGQAMFFDVTPASGTSQLGFNYGVSVADFDNDGDDDILAVRLMQGASLFRNNADGTFSDVTASAGIFSQPSSQFAVWGDFNNDTWPDLVIGARDEPPLFFLNNLNGAFSEQSLSAGLLQGHKVKALLAADVDMDGWLDLYFARLGQENILYKNNGNGTFTDNAWQSGATDPLISMGAVFFDYDNDGDPDLYLTHDANIPNILYQNNGNGTFSDVSWISGTNIASMGMGVDIGDINNDGWMDIYFTNLGPNTLLLNNGNGTFSDITNSAGVGDPGMGWGCSFFDYDNDGWQDIYMANDSYFSPFPNLLFRNLGNNAFTVVSQNTPLHSMEAGYGFGCFDYNDDGKLDIYLANYSGSVGNQLFRNETTNSNNWLKIKLLGTESNRMGIGAKATLYFDNHIEVDEVTAGCSWASQNSPTLHFGLGETDTVGLLTIRWPSGIVDSFANVFANQTFHVTEGTGGIYSPPDPEPNPDTSYTAQSSPVFNNGGNDMISTTSLSSDRHELIPFTFPNPVSEVLQILIPDIHSGSNHQVVLEIYSATGHAVSANLEQTRVEGHSILRVQVSHLATGLYFFNINYSGKIFTGKFVKNP